MESPGFHGYLTSAAWQQALGKETVIVKSPKSRIPSDFVRTEYIEFGRRFKMDFNKYLRELFAQAKHYEIVADQLDRNQVLALDYLKRAYLITGDKRLKTKAKEVLGEAEIGARVKNRVEMLAANF